MATILIIDDHPTNREFLVTLLGYRGHHPLQAMDGAEALKVACAEPPDLIISVILMPTMDGYEFVRELHTDPALGHLPVIFSTAQYLDQEAAALAQQCSEQRYRDLVEGSIQGMTIYRHFTPLFVIQAFATMFGYRPEETALETLTRLFAPQEHERLRRYHDAHLRGEKAPQ